MSVKDPSDRQGLGTNQYQVKPPRPLDPDTASRNHSRARGSRNGVGQLAERPREDWVDEAERLTRKQTRLSSDIAALCGNMRAIEPLSDEYYDTLDRVEGLERDLEITNQEIHEASLRAEGLTAQDVASRLPGRLTDQYFALDGALGALDEGGVTPDALWEVEAALTTARRDVLFLNRQGVLKGAAVNAFCDAASLHAAQLRRITTNGNSVDATAVRGQLADVQSGVSRLAAAATQLTAPPH